MSLQELVPSLLGAWATEGSHTQLPGEVLVGTASFTLLGEDGFLVLTTTFEHPQMPDAIALLRGDEQHYFDERGVRRRFSLTVSEDGFDLERPKVGEDFGQRMRWWFDGPVLRGQSSLTHDGRTWEHDLTLVARRLVDGRPVG